MKAVNIAMEEIMENSNRLQNYFKCDGFSIKRIFTEKDVKSFEELNALYVKNKEHLYYWHGDDPEFDFKISDDYIRYLKNYNLLCYVVLVSGRIIGFVGITKLVCNNSSRNFRHITYWIDKDNAGHGIMYRTLSALEESLRFTKTDYLIANVYGENKASIRLLEKLNFEKKFTFIGLIGDKAVMPNIEYIKYFEKQAA